MHRETSRDLLRVRLRPSVNAVDSWIGSRAPVTAPNKKQFAAVTQRRRRNVATEVPRSRGGVIEQQTPHKHIICAQCSRFRTAIDSFTNGRALTKT